MRYCIANSNMSIFHGKRVQLSKIKEFFTKNG